MTFQACPYEWPTERFAGGGMAFRHENPAAQVPGTTRRQGREVAKVVVLRDGSGDLLMVALPALFRLDLDAVARATGRQGLRTATEEELGPLFADCERGSRPSFGHIYGVPVYVDACFQVEPEVFFPAGNHHEMIGMRPSDYEAVAPVFGAECFHRASQAA